MSKRAKSEFILGDVLNKLQYFQPIEIYIDDKLIWDDNRFVGQDWIPYDQAIKEYGDIWSTTVRRVDIKVVHFHYSVIEIFTTKY
jgi:hypothetical protein